MRTGPRSSGARRIASALGDATGRSADEVVISLTAAATAALALAAWRSLSWTVLAVTDVDLRPAAPGRQVP